MNTIKIFLFAAIAALTVACSNDDVDANNSIFPTREENTDSTAFDKWLNKNYTEPYNIRFNYLYIDQNSDMGYNVSPADIKKSIALAKIIKHVWLDAYTELMGPNFLKQHCFREFQLIGSAQHKNDGSIVLGFAEGGIRVNLFQVNYLDPAHLYIEQTNPFASGSDFDLNRAYFHTMHHEFAHILTQLKDYSTDFRTITKEYHSADWVNVKDEDAGKEGYVTGYASSEYNEDFAEVFSCYVTDTDVMWQKRLAQAVAANGDETGKKAILAKLSIIRSYLKDSWGVDIDKLRTIVLRRAGEVNSLDLETLN
ncbi:zinc-binding metallopeptidase [Prevotella jejuni]